MAFQIPRAFHPAKTLIPMSVESSNVCNIKHLRQFFGVADLRRKTVSGSRAGR